VAIHQGQRFVYAGKVGTGYTDIARQMLFRELERDRATMPTAEEAPRLRGARWVKPHFVAQVAFTEWTADGKLRHPSFQGLRQDKRPEEAERECPG
jgi:bifunctional non-homologous end joining protein LigD